LRNPNCIEQVEFNGVVDVTTVTSEVLSGAPGQAGGYKHSANDSAPVAVLSSKGSFHHPNLGRMVLDTIGPVQSPPAIRKKKWLETTQFETSTLAKTTYL
jgi:hypothetical protein